MRAQTDKLRWTLTRTAVACAWVGGCVALSQSAYAADPVPALGSAKSLVVRTEPLGMPEVLTTRALQTSGSGIRSVVVSDLAATYEPLLVSTHSFKHAPNSCKNDGALLCYDYRTGKAIYKPSKQWVPAIAGLKAEGLSAKRDKVTFIYSFK